MNHAGMPEEIYELYVLGALEPEEAQQIETHLLEGCEECAARLDEANRVVIAMAGIAEIKNPPAALRERIVASVTPASARAVLAKHGASWMYAFAAAAAACIVLLVLAIWFGEQNGTLHNQIAATLAERNELRSALEFMSRQETRTVQFGTLENAPRGRVFVGRSGGVVFVGSHLPPLANGKTFELWVVPAKGAPKPAGLFRPSAAGDSVDVSSPGLSATGAAAIAVSVEPSEGSSAPTTKPFLIVPLS